MPKNDIQKSRKLFLQISLTLLPIFALITAAVLLVVYFSSVNSFLEAQNEYMRNVTDTTYRNLDTDDPEQYVLFQSYFEQHPSEIEADLTEEEVNAYNDAVDSEYSIEEQMQSSEILLRAWAKMYLRYIISNFKGEYSVLSMSNYSKAFIIDATDEHMGLFICKYNKDSDGDEKYSFNEFDPSAHPEVTELIESGSDKFLFEKTNDFPDDGNYYICYKPIIVNGKTQALLGVAFNWDDLHNKILGDLTRVFLMIICGLLFALILLQFILYRKAILPVRKIQETIREYKDNKDSSKVYSEMSEIKVKNEFSLLSQDISDLAKEIDFYTEENVRLAAERERVTAELDLATKIQADQLPSRFPAFPDRKDFDIYASMTPAKEVGGDFYDFFLIDDDRLALVIADVSGKGIPAALFMMMSKNLIKDHAMMKLSPKEIADNVNRMLCENNKQDMFVTAWIGILELSTGKISAVNAGHEFPAILRTDGKFRLFEDHHCFVLGGMKRAVYSQYEFTLPKGGTLFLYTDGVTEATNAEDVMFGEDRVVEALNKYPDAPPKELLEGIRTELDSFVGTAPQYDDITMLGIKLN
ncbi:Stage II sporulation protein E (SpoIIE) [Ruminococcaceae bacterium FB2012]|nr:Stage II sporulation protein E (SpoIIE) [Ruminococcaceae bacterium FB2012]